MTKLSKRKKSAGSKETSKDLSEDLKDRVNFLCTQPVEIRHLRKAISHLRHEANLKQKLTTPKTKHCIYNDIYCCTKTRDNLLTGYNLRARQANYIADELRKAILQHDWDSAARLLLSIINTGIRSFSVLVIRACLVIVFNHPLSTPEMLTAFLKSSTEYILDSDVAELIKLIFTIREKMLETNRHCSKMKSLTLVIRDPTYTSVDFNTLRLNEILDDPRLHQTESFLDEDDRFNEEIN